MIEYHALKFRVFSTVRSCDLFDLLRYERACPMHDCDAETLSKWTIGAIAGGYLITLIKFYMVDDKARKMPDRDRWEAAGWELDSYFNDVTGEWVKL